VACREWAEAPGRRPGVKADLRPWSLRVSFYPVPSRPAIAGVEVPGGDQAAARTVMVAVPVSALVWPVRAGSGGDGRSALLVAGTSPIATGEPVVWCTVVVTAPAVVRRDGRVQAQGRPCDHAWLGAAEQELDRRCGPGTIDRIAAAVRPTGKIKAATKARARREMSVAATIRAVLLMTVMVRHEALLFRMEVKDPMALPP
jgi:hypothetical protein